MMVNGMEIVRQPGNLVAHLEWVEPAVGNRARTEKRPQNVAGNGPGGIAVAAVIDGQHNPVLEALGHQRTIEPDGQRFLGDLAPAERLDAFRGGCALGRRLPCAVHRGERFVVMS